MQKLIAIFIVIFIAGSNSALLAQHCPWDGARTLVISLKDKFGVPIVAASSQLKLKEVENADPSQCRFVDKVIEKDFATANDLLHDIYKQHFDSWLLERCKDCDLTGQGNYAVKIGQAETNCMVHKNNDYTYIERKFVVEYSGVTPAVQIPVEKSDFQANCTSNSHWKPAKPLNFFESAK